MSRVTNRKGRSKVSVGEAASRVGEPVYHTGQGQDERARPRPAHRLRGLDSAWSGGSNPHRESGTRWRAAADVGAGQGQGSRSAEGRRGNRLGDSVGAQAPCAGERSRSVQRSPWGATQRCGRLSSGGVWPRRMRKPRCFKGGRLIAGLVHPHAVDVGWEADEVPCRSFSDFLPPNEVGHRRGTLQPFSVAPFPNCTGPFPSIQLSRENRS